MSAEDSFGAAILDFFNDDPLDGLYHKISDVAYDPATSSSTSNQTDITVKCILLDFERIGYGLSSKFGTEILVGDKDCYIYPPNKVDPLAPDLSPNPTIDRITIAGSEYKVVNVKEINPKGNSPMLYNLLLRR